MQREHEEKLMNVAVLGLGLIGSAWAKNLQEDGHEVRVWNRTPREFPGFSRIEEAVGNAQTILVVVADPPAVESVLNQIAPRLKSNQTVIQSSTISSDWSKKFAAQVEKTGARFLEAPFTGSKPAAEARKTVFYLGGDEAVINGARPVLEPLSQAILHIGPVGSASSLKLAMNINIAGVAQALCESLALARSQGIADEVFFDALHLNASRSGLSDLKEPKLREEDYAPQFSVKHMAKDIRLALETAGELELPQTQRVCEIYNRGIEAGWQDDDFISLMRFLQSE